MSILYSKLYTINITEWFSDRKLDFCPKHFIKSTIFLTPDSKRWIRERLIGRYAFYTNSFNINRGWTSSSSSTECPAFEDPGEAVMFELTWS